MSNEPTDPPTNAVCPHGRTGPCPEPECDGPNVADPPADPTDDVGPPTRTLCQIDNCMQHAVAFVGGANVCADHREWKRGKSEGRPTVRLEHTCHAMNPPFPGPCAACNYDRAMERVNAHQTAEQPATAPSPMPVPVCGGARIGWRSKGCGTPLRYEHTANGVQYWRCPQCGNPHWWPDSPLERMRLLVTRLDIRYEFQCEAGPLRNCVEWQALKAELDALLKLAGTPTEGPFPLSEPRLSWEAAIARDIARREAPHGPSLWLLHELRTYLDTLTITGDTIGDIRRACFLPWDSAWNGLVRDETATREGRGVSAAVPPAPTSTPGPQARAGARHVSDLTRSELVRGLAECIARVENAARTASRTDFVRAYVSEVDGLLVAARAARVALDMPLQPSIDAVVRQILCEFVGFFSGDVPELHGVEVPRLAESLDRFLRALAKDAL